jgi:hypothetical protein
VVELERLDGVVDDDRGVKEDAVRFLPVDGGVMVTASRLTTNLKGGPERGLKWLREVTVLQEHLIFMSSPQQKLMRMH